MNIIKMLKKTLKLLKTNWKGIFGFEIYYRLLTIFIFVPLLSKSFSGVMEVTGQGYLTKENFKAFISSPFSILLILLLVTAVVIIEMWHIGTIICFLDQSEQGKAIKVQQAFVTTVKRSVRIFRKENIAVLFYLLVLLPFLNVGSGIVGGINIFSFARNQIFKSMDKSLAVTAVILILFCLVVRWMFVLPGMFIEENTFIGSLKKSAALTRKCKIKNVISMMIVEIQMTIAYSAAVIAAVLVIAALTKLSGAASDFMISAVFLLQIFLLLLFYINAIPLLLAMLVTLFVNRKEQLGEPVSHIEIAERNPAKTGKRKLKIVFEIVMFLILIIPGALFVRGLRHGDYNLNIEHVRTMEVSAHRGASAYYPENTMAAFRGAVKQNADWIELDVQESKDGQIFVMHDTNFKRTTGSDTNCWEMTWDEISQLDAGSFFSEEYAGEKIPLLKEVIEYAKTAGIRLNIELKPTGHETDFEKKVIDIINEENFRNSCVITSQSYEVLENIKAYDDSITTVYVMGVAMGEIEDLDCADNFSIDSKFVTTELVEKMHALHKEVYAWTVDTEEDINAMIEKGADNIITNNVPLAKQCVEESKTSNLIVDIVSIVKQFANR